MVTAVTVTTFEWVRQSSAMEILIDELQNLLGVVLDILAERLVIEGSELGDDAVDHGW